MKRRVVFLRHFYRSSCSSNRLFGPGLAGLLYLLFLPQASSQTFTTLYNFSGASSPSYTNADGANPAATLTLSGATLYGTTQRGGTNRIGSSGTGTIFAINTDGSNFRILHYFNTNSDGFNPVAGLVLSGDTLYGTTAVGGLGGGSGGGTVFKVKTNGTGYASMHVFNDVAGEGRFPYAGVMLSGNTLYGTTAGGGGWGSVYKLQTDGTGFTKLYSSFTTSSTFGAMASGLVLSGALLYGATANSGTYSLGTVYAITTNGTGFTNLYNFSGSDGSQPFGQPGQSYGFPGLVLSGTALYGTTTKGGLSGNGTVFAINTGGTGFRTLYDFAYSDGVGPIAGLTVSGNTLYGTTQFGGNLYSHGIVFSLNTDGTGFTVLHTFTTSNGTANTNLDGFGPTAGLTLSGNTLYGTAKYGGRFGNGTIFSIALPGTPPQLTLTPSTTNMILTWPANASGFTLQSTTNLASSVWVTNTQVPTVVNGQNTVTNLSSSGQQFFHLIK